MTTDDQPDSGYRPLSERTRCEPGRRYLLSAHANATLPHDIAIALKHMGRATNTVGVALARGLIDHDHALEQFDHPRDDGDDGSDVQTITADRIFEITNTYIRGLSSLYAATAAPYAVYAADIAAQAVNRQPFTPPEPTTIVIADILLLPAVHLPLIQINTEMIDNNQPHVHVAKDNAALADSHRLLYTAIKEALAATSPNNDRDTPLQDYVVEPELPGLLHEYATNCLMTLEPPTTRHFP